VSVFFDAFADVHIVMKIVAYSGGVNLRLDFFKNLLLRFTAFFIGSVWTGASHAIQQG